MHGYLKLNSHTSYSDLFKFHSDFLLFLYLTICSITVNSLRDYIACNLQNSTHIFCKWIQKAKCNQIEYANDEYAL